MAAHAVTDSRPAPNRPGARAPTRRHAAPKVFLHIGEPKTGTTFLQQVMWRNRAELAARGVVLPGHHPQDHFRASQDLRGIAKLASDPAGSWTGEWEILASQAQQARQARGHLARAVLGRGCGAGRAGGAARCCPPRCTSCSPCGTWRTLLPAEWQETVKHRNTRGWEDWLGDVIDRESRRTTGASGGSGGCTTRWRSSTSGPVTCRRSACT